MSMNKKDIQIIKDQSGIVSIMVTLIIMMILSLIVLGFAQLMRREQRQSLDYQLSTQAFYAAEAGINDAVNAIKGGYNTKKEQCEPDASGPLSAGTTNNVLDADSLVAYTCLLVDPSPPEITPRDIGDNGWVTPLKTGDGTDFTEITIAWGVRDGTDRTGCPGFTGLFPPNDSWPANCHAGVLRVDLVPVEGSVDRPGLANTTMTAFFYPHPTVGSNISYNSAIGFGGPDGQGRIVNGDCSGGAQLCKVTITGLTANSYYLRLKSIYRLSDVTITGKTTTGTTNISGSQAIVDSTGKANDVLRRIQVRVPLHNSNNDTPDALRSVNTLCKRFMVAPGMVPEFNAISGCQP